MLNFCANAPAESALRDATAKSVLRRAEAIPPANCRAMLPVPRMPQERCCMSDSDWLELPLRRLAEEAAGVVEEDVRELFFAVAALAVFKHRVGQHARRRFAPVAGAVDADHVGAELFEDVGRSKR